MKENIWSDPEGISACFMNGDRCRYIELQAEVDGYHYSAEVLVDEKTGKFVVQTTEVRKINK